MSNKVTKEDILEMHLGDFEHPMRASILAAMEEYASRSVLEYAKREDAATTPQSIEQEAGQPFESFPDLGKIIEWFANNVKVPGTQWNELLRQINKTIGALRHPVPESVWVKCADRLPVGRKMVVNTYTSEVGTLVIEKDQAVFYPTFSKEIREYRFDDKKLYDNFIWIEAIESTTSQQSGDVKILINELKSIISGYDHDSDAHKYNNLPACVVCSAEKALSSYQSSQPEQLKGLEGIADELDKLINSYTSDVDFGRQAEDKAKERFNTSAATMWRHKRQGLERALKDLSKLRELIKAKGGKV